MASNIHNIIAISGIMFVAKVKSIMNLMGDGEWCFALYMLHAGHYRLGLYGAYRLSRMALHTGLN